MRAAILSVLALAACGGTEVPDVCATYPGQTCIALEVKAEHGTSEKVDQLGFDAVSGIDFGASPLLSPASPLATPVALPFVEPILPGPSFAGGSFDFYVRAYLGGEPFGLAEASGDVAIGAHVKLSVTLGGFDLADMNATPDGDVNDGGADAAHDVGPAAPHLLAPMPTAHVTKKRPTLHWQLAAGTDGARVEICPTRDCASTITTIEATGDSAVPSIDLPAGHTLFWRVFGKLGDTVGDVASPTWELVPAMRDTPIDSSYGTFLDLDGDGLADLAIGEPGAGKVFVYYGKSTWPAQSPGAPDATIVNASTPDFGNRSASAGDVDGDGYVDLLVGACPGAQAPSKTCVAGAVYLYRGGPSGVSTTPTSQLSGTALGYALDGAGDLDGDGYADLVAGSPTTGTAYLYRGSAAPSATLDATWTIPSPAGGGSDFGVSVAGLGDINGDGHPEVAIAASSVMPNGKVFIYTGGFPVGTVPSATFNGPMNVTSTAYTGISSTSGLVAAAGDLDGDGTADYFVSLTVALTSGAGASGPVYGYFGAAKNFSTFQNPVTLGAVGTANQALGYAAAAGDLDGDGYSDPVTSAPSAPTLSGTVTESGGSVYIYLSGGSGFAMNGTPAPVTTQVLMPAQAQTGHLLYGWTLAVADYNGDGKADIYATAPLASAGDGAAYLTTQNLLNKFVPNPAPFIIGPDPGQGFGY